MFGKRSKPVQPNQDDFAPADFSDDFADSFDPAEDHGAEDDAAAWAQTDDVAPSQPAATRQSAVKTQSGSPAKSSSSGLGKLLPWATVGAIGAVAAAYFFVLPQGQQPRSDVPEEVMQIPDTAPVVASAPQVEPAAEAVVAQSEVVVASSPEAPEMEAIPDQVVSPETTDSAAPQLPSPVVAMPALSPSVAEALPAGEVPLASMSDKPVLTVPVTVPAQTVANKPPVLEVAPVLAPVAPVSAPVVAAVPAVSAPVVSAPTQPVPSTPSKNPMTQPSAPALAAPQVDALTARLTILERQMDELAKAVDKLAAVQPGSDVAKLSKSVEALSKQVATLSVSKAAVIAPSPESASRVLVAPAAEPAVKPSVSEPVLSATASAPVLSAPAKTEPAVKPVAPVMAAKPAPSWVLRAAQSGMAWVSPSRDGELQRVAVGETLPGIGKITAIEIKDGAWEITGTKGKVRQ